MLTVLDLSAANPEAYLGPIELVVSFCLHHLLVFYSTYICLSIGGSYLEPSRYYSCDGPVKRGGSYASPLFP